MSQLQRQLPPGAGAKQQQPPPPPSSPCWEQGRALFIERSRSWTESSSTFKRPPTKEQIAAFLDNHSKLDTTIDSCRNLKAKAENTYQDDAGKSKIITKLLHSLDAVKKIGDPFMAYAPESVSIAWSAISTLIMVGTEDLSQCELVSATSEQLVTIILNLRLFENRYYSEGVASGGDRDTELRIIDQIPNIIAGILEFSWRSQKYIESNRLVRSFKAVFSTKIKDIISTIVEDYKTLRQVAQDAFQERVMDYIQTILQDSSNQYNELKKQLFPSLDAISKTLENVESMGKDIKEKMERSENMQKFLSLREKLLRPTEHHVKSFMNNFEAVARTYTNMALWIFNNPIYKSWIRCGTAGDESSFLCLEGPRGFGKTVKMTCLVKRLQESTKIERHGESTPIVLWFYFKIGDEATQRLIRALESIAAQLFDEAIVAHDDELLKKFIAILTGVGSASEGGHMEGPNKAMGLTAEILVSIIEQAGKELKRPIFIAVDAVDECIDLEAECLIDYLKTLASSSLCTAKIIISSRETLDVSKIYHNPRITTKGLSQSGSSGTNANQKFADLKVLKVDEKANSDDLQFYLEGCVSEILMRRRGELKNAPSKTDPELVKIVSSIKERASGNFAYAALAIASLQKPSQLSLTARLRKLPIGMDEMYNQSLEVLGVEERKLVMMALHRVVWGCEKVYTAEVAEQYKQFYNPQDDVDDEEDDDDDEQNEVEQTIVDSDEQTDIDTTYDPLTDPEVIDTIHHLRRAGRDFFSFEGNFLDVHGSVREWVINQAAEGLKSQEDSGLFSSMLKPAKNGRWTLSIDLPEMLGRATSTTGLPTEREAHLDILIYCLHALINPKFQERYMQRKVSEEYQHLWEKEDHDEDQKEENEDPKLDLTGLSPEEIIMVKEMQAEAKAAALAEMEAEAEAEAQAAQLEALESEKIDNNNTELHDTTDHKAEEHDAEDQKPAPVNEESPEKPLEETNEKAPEKKLEGSNIKPYPLSYGYSLLPSKTLSIGSDVSPSENGDEDELDSLTADKKTSERKVRYEIAYWIRHMKLVDKLWPLSERRNEKWGELRRLMSEFAKDDVFRKWSYQWNIYVSEFPHIDFNIEAHPLPDNIDHDFSLLHAAAFYGIEALAKYLLEEHSPKPDVNATNREGHCPLHFSGQHPAMTKFLLDHGADTEHRDSEGMTPLLYYLQFMLLHKSEYPKLYANLKDKFYESCRLLVSRGADVTCESDYEFTAIYYAISLRDYDLVKLLLGNPAVLDAVDDKGLGPLHWCLGKDGLLTEEEQEKSLGSDDSIMSKIAALLIEKGADVNMESLQSKMPLSYAVRSHNVEGAEVLLKNGALVDDEDSYGFTALCHACQIDDNHGKASQLVKVFLNYGAKFDHKSESNVTPLAMAVAKSRIGVVEILLQCYEKKYGDDKSYLLQRDSHGRTLLYRAAAQATGGVDVAKAVLKGLSQEEIGSMLDLESYEQSMTPICIAAAHSNIEMMEYLIGLGANVYPTSASCVSALKIVKDTYISYVTQREMVSIANEKPKKPGRQSPYEDALVFMIERYPAGFSMEDLDVLLAATIQPSPTIIEKLGKLGITLDKKDSSNWSVFHHASLLSSNISLEDLGRYFPAYDIEAEISKPTLVPSRWVNDRNINGLKISEDGLECLITVENDSTSKTLVLADHPLPLSQQADRYYFEVTFSNEKPHEGSGSNQASLGPQRVEIGLLAISEQTNKEKSWREPSVPNPPGTTISVSKGFKSFYNCRLRALEIQTTTPQTSNTPLVIGVESCIKMKEGFYGAGVFFSLNRKHILGFCIDNEYRECRWYPCIRFTGSGVSARVNFGNERFKFVPPESPEPPVIENL